MIQMELNKIKVDENRSEQVIVLKESHGDRLLPVVIGISEVNAIKLRLSGITPPRPLTHDLLHNIINDLGAKVKKVVIDKLEKDTFFAKIVVDAGEDREIAIDARPSDSIALALRAEVPIFIENNVLDVAGLKPA